MDNNRIGRRRSHNTNQNYFEKEAYLSGNNFYISGPLSPSPLATLATGNSEEDGRDLEREGQKKRLGFCAVVCADAGRLHGAGKRRRRPGCCLVGKQRQRMWPATAEIEAAASAPPGGLVCVLTVDS
jgi:hypothetical protein